MNWCDRTSVHDLFEGMFLICEMGRRSTLPSCAMGMVQPWITERWDQSSCSVGKCASGGGGEALSQWVRVQKGWGCERDWLYSESTQNFNKTKSWLWTVGVGLPEENFQQLLEPDYRLRTYEEDWSSGKTKRWGRTTPAAGTVSQDCSSPIPEVWYWGEWTRDGEKRKTLFQLWPHQGFSAKENIIKSVWLGTSLVVLWLRFPCRGPGFPSLVRELDHTCGN